MRFTAKKAAMSDYFIYPRIVPFKKGKRLLLRFLNQGDGEDIIRLFREAWEDELCLLKDDFRDPKVVQHWLEELRCRRVLALAAVDLQGHRLAASANLHLGRDSARHVGEIRLFVSPPFRGLGLGSLLIKELLDLALDEDLKWLQVEVIAEQHQALHFFRDHGFAVQARLKDYFLRRDGVTHDVALLRRPVLHKGMGDPFRDQTGKGTEIREKVGFPGRK
jgi:L-amino acid N-acyltransferase YncA